jgi:hypothetical protein
MAQEVVSFFRQHLKTQGGVQSFIKHLMQVGQQNVHTPFTLCEEIIEKLMEYTSIRNKKISVLFNIEFLHTLVEDFGVRPEDITMFCDDAVEYEFCRLQYGMKPSVNLFQIDIEKTLEEKELYTTEGKCAMKFDVTAMNPPYQSPVENKKEAKGTSGRGSNLWSIFVKLGLSITKDDGHVAFIHPPKWRKPMDHLFPVLKNLNINYLETHSKKDGLRTFGASTPYDWYILQNKTSQGKTSWKDADGVMQTIDLRKLDFLPSCCWEQINKLLAKDGESKCKILFSRSEYGSEKSHMRLNQDSTYKYPCIASTGVKGDIKKMYSSKKSIFFGVPKVIFGESDVIKNVIIDIDGEYAMTNTAMALEITCLEDGQQIKRALESDAFNTMLVRALRWSQFRIDWRMFQFFRKDFWKEFL